tara:strand:- start:553 stop:795 length:243 start_codon:yes stop_codon:yes gene_type:complete
MNIVRNTRLVLAGVLFGLATSVAAPLNSTDPKNENKQYEYLKKAKYFEIRAQLEAGDLTPEQAQKEWKKALKKLEKREGK